MNEPLKHSYWACDGCNRNILHGEYRHNCTVCEDFDYCEQCAATINPRHPHKMTREFAYGLEGAIESTPKDMATAIESAVIMYSDRPCLGTRDVDKDNPSIFKDTYSWVTYTTVGERFRNFGNGLRTLIEPRGYLGICAANRLEWPITDFACVLKNIITVPIYTLFSDSEIAYVINNTDVTVMVCDRERLARFMRIKSQCPCLKHIVCMDPILGVKLCDRDDTLALHYMADIEQRGKSQIFENSKMAPEDSFTIIYTSGSSGFPKGVILSEKTFRATFSYICIPFLIERVILCYRPLAWAADRDNLITTFFGGGRTAFATGDSARLMEEIALVRPTSFSGSPSFWNKLYTEFQTSLALMTAQSSPTDKQQQEERLLKTFATLLSNRCRIITVGGALVSPIVFNFIKRCFTKCKIYESYGTTECGGITVDYQSTTRVEHRLESIPEMGYTTDDKPFPRGELLVRTAQMFSGYINNPEETRAAITEDGFFRTGDIVELTTNPDGSANIHIIDRKKSFFKLSSSQFVSPERLQGIYIQSPFVEQIYIHGDLLSDCVSAVVVPNRSFAKAYAAEHGLTDFDTNNPHPQFVDDVLRDLQAIGKKESLLRHEIPSRIIVDFEPFTPENGLLTASMKPCRHKLSARYGERLKATHNATEERLKVIVETITGQPYSVSDKEKNVFLNVGGDSLSAVRLSRMIEEELGVAVPYGMIFDSETNIEKLLAFVQQPNQFSSSKSIVPQLFKDSHLDPDIQVERHKYVLVEAPQNVLITGTTGFVGAFLLADLLRNYPSRSQFVCLVRCQSPEHGLDRIRQNMLYYQIWEDDFEQRIIPLKGDMAENRFGLDDTTYELLTHRIDIIFHCGASVNFVLPYEQLYRPNVVGTREIIRFATRNRSACIPLQYISTISVLPPDIKSEVSIEGTSPQQLSGGYSQSKWVAEQLVTEAISRGLRANIFRLGWICASSRTGACNPTDLYTLFVIGMMKTHCYPKSIVQLGLNGLPVDFTARCIVHLSSSHLITYGNIYHVVNNSPLHKIEFTDVIDEVRSSITELESVSYGEWKNRLKKMKDDHRLLEILAELSPSNYSNENSELATVGFDSAIGQLSLVFCERDLVSKWIHFLKTDMDESYTVRF